MLIENGAKIDQKNDEGLTPREIAEEKGKKMKYLAEVYQKMRLGNIEKIDIFTGHSDIVTIFGKF